MFWPCETKTSTCRNFATISSGLYRFLAIAVLLDVKDIPQVGPLQWGRIKPRTLWSNQRPRYVCNASHGLFGHHGLDEQMFGADEQVPKGACGPCPKNASGPGNSVRDILIFAGGGLSVWWRRRQKIG